MYNICYIDEHNYKAGEKLMKSANDKICTDFDEKEVKIVATAKSVEIDEEQDKISTIQETKKLEEKLIICNFDNIKIVASTKSDESLYII
jgi:hypothetical protein